MSGFWLTVHWCFFNITFNQNQQYANTTPFPIWTFSFTTFFFSVRSFGSQAAVYMSGGVFITSVTPPCRHHTVHSGFHTCTPQEGLGGSTVGSGAVKGGKQSPLAKAGTSVTWQADSYAIHCGSFSAFSFIRNVWNMRHGRRFDQLWCGSLECLESECLNSTEGCPISSLNLRMGISRPSC